jgi:PucR C-terminal helix-turn-helix domain/GGDEF-like domain
MSSRTALRETVATRLLAERERLAEEMTERINDGIEEFAGFDPELSEAIRVSCLANLDAGFTAMAGDLELPSEIPSAARDLALLTARLDLPLAALLRSYRIGQSMAWRLWFEAIESERVDDEARREALEAVTVYLFDYIDRLATFLADEYTAERDRFMRSREQRRTQLVRDVLDGADPDPAEAMRELDYDLRLRHLALVVAGPDGERLVRELGRELDAPHHLVVSLAGDTSWAWLGRVQPFELPERLEPRADALISIGDPGQGTDGFRRSHREARDAHRVAVRRGPERGVVRYDEVALESLIAADEPRERAFVARELRGLDGADRRSQGLRETLRAYFSCAQNASAAAAMLGVHEHTVSYRLRKIEERLGRPVATRRAELETALRLLELGGR